jgi:hypothetical protein
MAFFKGMMAAQANTQKIGIPFPSLLLFQPHLDML